VLPETGSEISSVYKTCKTLGVRADKSSIPIGAKVEISPHRLYSRSGGGSRKSLFNLPKVANEC
jgi:hypothetical protein